MKNFLLFFLILIIGSCSGQKGYGISSFATLQEFQTLADQPLSSKYGNISSVKVIFDLKNNRLHFIPGKEYKYHFEYAAERLNYTDGLTMFNILNYGTSDKREFLLGNLNRNDENGNFYIDISVFDEMPADKIVVLYNKVKTAVPFAKNLRFLLNNERLVEMEAALKSKIPTVTPEGIYEGMNYQAVSLGKTIGKLRFEESVDAPSSPILPTDIVITTKTPPHLPLLKGMVLTEMQTPLSHLVILGQNRHLPIGVSKSVFANKELKLLENEWVELRIESDTFTVRKASPASLSTDVKPIRLTKNISIDSLIPANYLKPSLASSVGNKAANFGILAELSGKDHFKVPEAAFAVPFYWYEKHMKESGAQALIRKLVSDPPPMDSLPALLKQIRQLINETPVNPKLLGMIAGRLKKSGFSTFRFRSSTNAEDARGFSGAGLYDSKTVDLNDPEKTAENVLRKVWASLWYYDAYMERSFFGIAQSDVAMGVLVHRSFPSEAANGVAITKNIYRGEYDGFVVNVQLGDASVVTPDEGVICDQLVLYPANELSGFKQTTEVITRSSLNSGKLVMTKPELEKLQRELSYIKQYYWRNYYKKKGFEQYINFGLDIEFKLDEKTRELYIKQVRVYNY